jgi:hypothetical protein
LLCLAVSTPRCALELSLAKEQEVMLFASSVRKSETMQRVYMGPSHNDKAGEFAVLHQGSQSITADLPSLQH